MLVCCGAVDRCFPLRVLESSCQERRGDAQTHGAKRVIAFGTIERLPEPSTQGFRKRASSSVVAGESWSTMQVASRNATRRMHAGRIGEPSADHHNCIRQLHSTLQSWIDRFAFESENAENALMHPPQRLAFDESHQRFEPQGELTDGERAFSTKPSLAQTVDVLG